MGTAYWLLTNTVPKDEELGKELIEKGYSNRIDTPEMHKKKMEAMFAQIKMSAESDKCVGKRCDLRGWLAI